jgi:RIO kinase 2
MKRTFRTFKKLKDEDFRILATIEACQRKSEYAPLTNLQNYSKMDLPDLEFHLKRLDSSRLIQSRGSPYVGYRLLHTGYDFLALNTLVQRDEVERIGDRIAVGKESEVYDALGPGDSSLVVKFHRLGLTSFSKAPQLRVYLGERRHYSWIYAARLAAEREFEALDKMRGHIKVPEAIDQNRNALLLSRYDGTELVDSRPESPEDLRDSIILEAKKAWKIGYVHGDLSEFNVMVGDDDFVIIDWPQWLESSHPQANTIHKRDIGNLRRFFDKKYDHPTRETA